MFAVFAMISALSAMFRQSSASGDGDGENDRQECFHSTKVFVADRSRAFIRWLLRLRGEWPIRVPEKPSAFLCIHKQERNWPSGAFACNYAVANARQ
jgi:hypothetical protein